MAAIGIVRSHAMPMLRATPHRTADSRFVAPTPMIAEVIVWVVEMGAWKTNAVVYRTEAAAVSATNPRAGSSSMILRPSVRMMRQPPEYVPSEIAEAAQSLTQSGMSVPVWKPPATSASTMTPMVFCASCRPCPSAMAAADTVCASRNRRWVLVGAMFLTIHRTPTMTTYASAKPTSGETTIGRTTSVSYTHLRAHE